MKPTQSTNSTSAKKALPLFGALFLVCAFLLSACADPGKGVPLGELFSSEVFVGDGTPGYADGQGTAARFYSLQGIAVAPDGNIYVADNGNERIRKITPSGMVTTFAGSTQGFADGQGTAAQFHNLKGIAFGPEGNLYVADDSNNSIRKISPDGTVSTLVSGGEIRFPQDLTISPDGILYITDGLNRIQKITPRSTPLVELFAGAFNESGFVDDQGAAARFYSPFGIILAPDGKLYVADSFNHLIRKITLSGMVTTFAGHYRPNPSISYDNIGGYADGQSTAAEFNRPYGIAFDPYGNAFVVDSDNGLVRRVSPTGKVSTILEGLDRPRVLAISPDASTAYVAERFRILQLRFR